MSKNVAAQVVDILANAGIKHIYAITGDSLNEVNNAVRENGKIQWIHVRHEESGAFAASAEAQLTGKLACCAGSSGPGHVHLINGLYDAHRANAPVIAIASTCPSNQFGMKYFQGTNTIKLFDDCSYFNQVASTPQQFARMMQLGIQTAISYKGVSVVGLPGDLTSENEESIYSSNINYVTSPQIIPSYEELKKLATLINDAKKVTLYCGIGCAEAHDEVVALAKFLKAPVAYTFRGKMKVEYDNPNEVGMTGLLGTPSGYKSMHKADLLLMLGTDFPYDQFIPDNIKIAQIDLRADRLGRRAKLTQGLCGDVKLTLAALMPMLEDNKSDAFLKEQLEEHKKVIKDLSVYIDDKGEKDKLHPEFVMTVVDKLASDSAVFTIETGMCDVWSARYLRATGKRDMIASYNHGSLGCAVPMSVGAALACPDRQIIAVCGDGGLSMTLGDLATIVQYKLPVKLIVFNNHSLGMVKLEMEVAGLPDWQTDMYNPDFEAVAKAMGMNAWTAHTADEVSEMISKAFEAEGAALVNVITDPNCLSMPSKVTRAEIKGFMESMAKMMMMGRKEEVEDTIRQNFKDLKEFL